MGLSVYCAGKVQYRTYTEAEKKVRAMKRNPHIDRSHQALGFYRCDDCRYFHIGNSNKLDKANHKGYKRSKYDSRSISTE